MRRTTILSVMLLAAMTAGAEVFWQRSISNYNRQTYHAGSQNWMIGENDRGWMYFANSKGLLEYDGVYWNLYAIGQNIKARAMLTKGHTVYVGGLGEFGYFSPDERGHLLFHSLSDSIRSQRAINIWRIHEVGGDIYFQADNAVYVLHDGKVRQVNCQESIECSGTVSDKLYVATARGLSLLSGNGFVALSGTEGRPGTKVVALLRHEGGMLVVNSVGDIYRYAGGSLSELPIKCHANVAAADVQGDLLALGTVQDGLILLNLDSGEMEHLSTENGLQNKSVLAVKFDRHRNLWLGYDSGIGYIPLESPLFFLGSSYSAIGAGYASCVFQGQLYLATNQGIYTMAVPDRAVDTAVTPHFLDGTSGQVHCLREVGGTLFCGGRYFFMTINGNHTTRYDLRGVWNVTPIGQQADKVILGTYFGLYLMRRQADGWTAPVQISGSEFSAKSLCVEQGSNAVWVANKAKGIRRLTLSDNLTGISDQKSYNTAQLPTGENVCLAIIDDDMVVAARQGLFRYNITNDRMDRHTALERLLGEGLAYTYIYQDQQRNIWYAADGILRLLRYDQRTHNYDKGGVKTWLSGNLIEDYESVNLYNGRAIIGTDDGFAMLQMAGRGREQTAARLQIRRMYTTANMDSLVYEDGMDTDGHPVRISYADGSVRIEYGVVSYDKNQTVLYAYRLIRGPVKEDDAWSTFSAIHSKEYTHLREGHYTFQVRTLAAGGLKPSVATIDFTILPPWYRTWWAYLLYVLIAFAMLYYAYLRLMESRRNLIQRGQEQLARQERQFKAESEEKDREIETLRDEKMEVELRSKSAELVQSRINIVRKNEMLEEIRKSVQSIYNNISEDNLPSVKRRISKLLGQIDTNLGHDEDVQAFQSSFDAVHHDFFKVLGERYPDLSYKEKMLCAYIKMNMLTKEIAPLLNISVRGVEIGRYRLRKKLGLDERENLTTFLERLSSK